EIVPVHDRIEAHGVRPLGLPAPVWPERVQHDVTCTNFLIDQSRATREQLATLQRARQKHVLRFLRELNDDARRRARIRVETCHGDRTLCSTKPANPPCAATTTAAPTGRVTCLRDVEVIANARRQSI